MFIILLLAPLIIGGRLVNNDNEIFGLETTKSLKGLFACCVLLHHLFPFYSDMFLSLRAYGHLGFIAVSGFFMISGYGLTYGVMRRDGYLNGFIIKRMMPIVVSYYVSSLIYMFMFRYAHSLSPDRILNILTARNYWFVYAILIFYLGFYISFRIFRGKAAMISSCVWIFAYISFMGFYIISTPGCKGFWLINSALSFPAGIVFAMYKERIVEFIKKRYIIKLIASAAVFAASFTGELLIPDPKSPFILICELIASVSLCVLIAALSVKFRIKSRILEWLGEISLELYLVFAAFEAIFYKASDGLGESAVKVVIIFGFTVAFARLVHKAQKIIMSGVKKVFKI